MIATITMMTTTTTITISTIITITTAATTTAATTTAAPAVVLGRTPSRLSLFSLPPSDFQSAPARCGPPAVKARLAPCVVPPRPVTASGRSSARQTVRGFSEKSLFGANNAATRHLQDGMR